MLFTWGMQHEKRRMPSEKQIWPYFPLGIFLFPGEEHPLRIFEPRYQQLINDVRSSGKPFVIPYVSREEIQPYGCEVELDEVVGEHPEGRMVINVRSREVVEILSYEKRLGDRLYAGGRVAPVRINGKETGPGLQSLIGELLLLDPSFLSCCGGGLNGVSRLDLLKALNLSSEDKHSYVRSLSVQQEEAFLNSRLRFLMMIRRQEQQLDNDYGLN